MTCKKKYEYITTSSKKQIKLNKKHVCPLYGCKEKLTFGVLGLIPDFEHDVLIICA